MDRNFANFWVLVLTIPIVLGWIFALLPFVLILFLPPILFSSFVALLFVKNLQIIFTSFNHLAESLLGQPAQYTLKMNLNKRQTHQQIVLCSCSISSDTSSDLYRLVASGNEFSKFWEFNLPSNTNLSEYIPNFLYEISQFREKSGPDMPKKQNQTRLPIRCMLCAQRRSLVKNLQFMAP